MPSKKRVLFLCIGNSCRSPMAEGFARAYGSDILEASSAGLSIASIVQPLTRKVMRDRNISIEEKAPFPIEFVDLSQVDLIVNLSGMEVHFPPEIPVLEWRVRDPIGAGEGVYEQVRDEIEARVVRLILDMRGGAEGGASGKS